MDNNANEIIRKNRRQFIQQGIQIAAVTGITGVAMFGCKGKEEGEDKEVSPPEDLMQEHGLLNRVLLIYDYCKSSLLSKQAFDVAVILNSANIIRTFVEDYHEKLEENFLFPRFEKANLLVDLVKVLRTQHQAGRRVTDITLRFANVGSLKNDSERAQLIDSMQQFIRMYNPHEAREDTVLFPAFRKIVSLHEFDSLGEDFEKKENELFGEDGFEKVVDQVAAIEKRFGIYELAQFTPRL